jgi:arylsulfatase
MQKTGVAPADVTLPAANLIAKRRWDALTPEQQKTQARLMATFAAMVDNQDQSIGQLLDYLKSTKQLVNRLIIDLSDNDPEAFDG